MEMPCTGAVNPSLSLLSESFFFASPWKSFITRGRFAEITCPAADGDSLQGVFQQQVRNAFTAARAKGIQHPVMVGAIPFDTRQPSALFIPEHHETFSHQRPLQAAPVVDPIVTARQNIPEQAEFMAMVARAAEATTQPGLDKVVLSRLIDITTAEPVQATALMDRLIALNPGSYHFHVPLTDGSTLLGASPELLLRKSGETYSSLPLAGSARRDRSDKTRDLAVGEQLMYSQKDRYEHHLVTRAMYDVLKTRSRYLAVPDKPELVTTSTLWHLATAIEGMAASAEETALTLACLLHPTPALNGYPHVTAREWIEKLEPFERGLFGGIVGWCDDEGNGEWVVTIRCGTLAGKNIRLFAGAGIVPASSPASEWHETGVKLSTMLHVFGLQ